jgi:hypothetical protein
MQSPEVTLPALNTPEVNITQTDTKGNNLLHQWAKKSSLELFSQDILQKFKDHLIDLNSQNHYKQNTYHILCQLSDQNLSQIKNIIVL